ncbi:hypothetical protein J4H86_05345 [Spiractinospora alimapuensis]|uniref:SAV_6107 family HEPN domain-containing protein n=1 Tax=Spiractinospora alimapuensis TaxID=2820884 RepID=UPI001EEA4396|nr:SAV_6107 family HEPN domain-containing protein [Spiractinospora alimapuensis]QVQ53207.1 hypothetical protein J4H86_05345 [Spiractinospora alimapuensis]
MAPSTTRASTAPPPESTVRSCASSGLVPAARRWLAASARHLSEAREGHDPRVRYIDAHMAALRAAAAMVEQRRAERGSGRARPRSVWEQLPRLAPELTPWVGVFLASAERRAAIEVNLAAEVEAGEVTALLRAAESFVAAVHRHVGDQVL